MPVPACGSRIPSGGPMASHTPVAAAVKLACLVFFLVCSLKPAAAQQNLQSLPDFGKNPEWFPRVYKPYQMKKIPELKLASPGSFTQFIHDGKLRISLAQLKTAVEENNLDILSSKNGARYAQTDMLRAKGGGAPRGGAGVQIPSGLFAGAIGAGVGGFGGLGGFGSAGGITGGARQVIGFPRGSYDPSLAFGFSVDRTNSPLNSIVVSGLPEVTTNSTALQARYSQSFTFGSSISVSFNNMRQSSTQKFLLYNPYFVSQFSINFTQQLLSGFGLDIGRRFLDVAKNESKIMQENVHLQVNTTLAQAQDTYWNLVAARENVRVAGESLAVSRRLYEDNKNKEEIGTASGLDVVTAASEVASMERDLVTAQTALQMREVELKNIISKDLSELLGPVQIEPIDTLPDPKESDIPKLSDALTVAMKNRPEIRQAEVNLLTQDIAIKYSRDLLKPTLLFFANFNSSGLYGDRIIEDTGGAPIILAGGISGAMRQVLRWNYPEYAVGFSFSLNIRNRAAQADLYRAKLEKRQTETGLQRTRNSIALEVRKAVIGLVQSRAQVEAARKAVELSGQTLAAEESKLMEGTSVPYEVIRRQRDYRSAQFAEVQARANYAKALVERDRAMGVLNGNDQ
jgi:outer membrane protein